MEAHIAKLEERISTATTSLETLRAESKQVARAEAKRLRSHERKMGVLTKAMSAERDTALARKAELQTLRDGLVDDAEDEKETAEAKGRERLRSDASEIAMRVDAARAASTAERATLDGVRSELAQRRATAYSAPYCDLEATRNEHHQLRVRLRALKQRRALLEQIASADAAERAPLVDALAAQRALLDDSALVNAEQLEAETLLLERGLGWGADGMLCSVRSRQRFDAADAAHVASAALSQDLRRAERTIGALVALASAHVRERLRTAAAAGGAGLAPCCLTTRDEAVAVLPAGCGASSGGLGLPRAAILLSAGWATEERRRKRHVLVAVLDSDGDADGDHAREHLLTHGLQASALPLLLAATSGRAPPSSAWARCVLPPPPDAEVSAAGEAEGGAGAADATMEGTAAAEAGAAVPACFDGVVVLDPAALSTLVWDAHRDAAVPLRTPLAGAPAATPDGLLAHVWEELVAPALRVEVAEEEQEQERLESPQLKRNVFFVAYGRSAARCVRRFIEAQPPAAERIASIALIGSDYDVEDRDALEAATASGGGGDVITLEWSEAADAYARLATPLRALSETEARRS